MRLVFIAILIVLILLIVFMAEASRRNGRPISYGRYMRLLLIISLLAIGALFYPDLRDKLDQYRSKLR